MTKSLKITFIGGGSYQWVPTLFRDIAVNPALQDARFVLHDHHAGRNEELTRVCEILARKLMENVQFTVDVVDDLPVNPGTRKFQLIVDKRQGGRACQTERGDKTIASHLTSGSKTGSSNRAAAAGILSEAARGIEP